MSLLRERGDGVAVLRLDRPRVRNALGGELVEALGAALAGLDDDPGVRVAVLTGTPPGFCAGSDLKELSRLDSDAMVRHEAATGRLARQIQHLGIPVIAAVEGFAMGGGFLLATSCDIVVTAGDARWHLPEVQLGWVPPWGVQSLVARVGPVTARRLVWGERPLTGGEVYALGAADELTVRGEALERALEVAEGLARLPAHAVASAKRALADAVGERAETLDARTAWMFGADCGSEAARRSLTRFHSPV
ncbi:enoyl-CoA hydratase/isomerase family protein [Nonomuraea sp. PA05]|uniref:enoyl-CoA hydratase/isomerase family protein n=1 Tax=Nonomuraea sp. PA05 TaxID=2604466 RepID=UPI0011D36C20|nr:enoyl-CoA hydratase/isomerase family protein [Nonomuraea sp. PA05]TYB71347.1 enoyl-CoA hydratase/isomerase family protein [Nonomuraea sp. PA05]